MSAWKHIRAIGRIIAWPFEANTYRHPFTSVYYSSRYDKSITVEEGFKCDGASWSPNFGISWVVHDKLFRSGKWDDGSRLKWRQANRVMLDIMEREEHPEWVKRLIRRGVNSKYGLKAWQQRRKKDPISKVSPDQLSKLLS